KTDDGGKWIGFSGSLALIDGLAAGGSVEGLRITWYDPVPGQQTRAPKITLNGAGVEFEVPDVFYFKGSVSYRDLDVTNDAGQTIKAHRFEGAITLVLNALDLEIDGILVIEKRE